MAISKVFLDWKAPALPATAAYLSERYAAAGVLDLQQTLVVTPGGRAGRRLLELLVEYAEAHHLALVPPQIVTMGQLPELLYETPRPFAPALTQQLAWVTALRQTERPIVASLTSAPPTDHDLFACNWLRVFRGINPVPFGPRVAQTCESRVGLQEKYAACRGSMSDGMYRIAAYFERAL